MKKTKKWLAIGILLIFAGIIGFVACMSVLKWDFLALDTEVFADGAYVPEDGAEVEFSAVDIVVKTGAVVIVEGEALSVEYKESEHVKMTVAVEGGTLIIRQTEKYRFSMFTFKRTQIVTKVTVPEGTYAMRVNAEDSRLEMSGLALTTLKAETDNGKVLLSDTTANAIDLETDNGRIELNNVAAEIVKAEASNGKIVFNKVTADSVNLESSNGTVSLTDVLVNSHIIGKCSNGRIGFTRLECPDIRFTADNGRIEGSIVGSRDEYSFDLKASNGKISPEYERGTGMKKLFCRTSNGGIYIDFTE